MNSSPPQPDVVAEAWTADLLVFGQALYHWATLPPLLKRVSMFYILKHKNHISAAHVLLVTLSNEKY